MKYAGLGGSSVPAAVTRRLAGLGITVFRSYGSTEHPSITGSPTPRPRTSGSTPTATRCPAWRSGSAEDGEILSRGPDLCLGYTDPALTERAFDDDGWYRTGDIGVLDEDGYLTITDRKADIIIRGGENISALEVEEVLLALPAVAEAAVVAAPDARLGEHAAAVVRLRPGRPRRRSTRCAPTSSGGPGPAEVAGGAARESTSSRGPRAARSRSSFSAGHCRLHE
jgi:acyl-CoA synthetase